MLLLAFEAAGPGVSVALGEARGTSAKLLDFRNDVRPGAGDRLIEHIGQVLAAASLNLRDLSALVVDRGPGSFTGIRTAVAAARALALCSGRPLLAASRLEVLASLVEPLPGWQIAAMVRAGRSRVLVQTFDAAKRPSSAPRALPSDRVMDALDRPVVVVCPHPVEGPAAATGRIELRQVEVDARALLQQACGARPALADVRPFELEPLYPRPPDALPPRPLIARPDDPTPAHARPQA